MSDTDEYTDSTAAIPSGWENIPCVQYGHAEDGPTREPTLRTLFEPIPDGAVTASPIYVLTRDQYDRQKQLPNGYAVQNSSSIAKELQDECEADDRVLYPVHIESDKYHQEDPATLIRLLREFVEDYLGVPFSECTLYFSGNRSIHVHLPRLVSGEDQRECLKQRAETFCRETTAELDCALYSRKRLFRLPGVEHAESELPKVEVQPSWEHSRIIRKASQTEPETHDTYADVLAEVFISKEGPTANLPQRGLNDPQALFRTLDAEDTVLELEPEGRNIEEPLIEQGQYPNDPVDAVRWLKYNAKEFSPYACAEGSQRSVAVLRVKEGAFARQDTRDGATMVPAYFFGAVGANGEFTKRDEHAPLQLSKRDYAKWNYEPGEVVAVIGGQSRSSRLMGIEARQAKAVGAALFDEGDGREAALNFLEAEGYDTGNAGTTATSSTGTPDDSPSRTTVKEIWPARANPQSDAAALQRRAEKDGIDSAPSHKERIQVACRHLHYGWRPTWEWFQSQYGPAFDPQLTHQFLSGIVEDERYDEYDHVEVPPEP